MQSLKKIKILHIDDHPVVIEACREIFKNLNSDLKTLEIDDARNCDTAIAKIELAAESTPYDIVIVDLQIPESLKGKIIDGEDLAMFATMKLPNVKIMVLTAVNDNFRIINILKTINPSGLLIKTDINSNELLMAITKVIYNPPYYSSTVMQLLRNQVSLDNLEQLDSIDRKIILQLSKGVKTKNLVDFIPLSLSAIEKRKSIIKQILGIEKGDDAAIIERAKEMGII
ncbi:response regulator [Aurantibacter sp.]|uniref:response regulator n=1 Tax=Aurantibacter sp. TaxID=2807103 RepID=UPI0032676921